MDSVKRNKLINVASKMTDKNAIIGMSKSNASGLLGALGGDSKSLPVPILPSPHGAYADVLAVSEFQYSFHYPPSCHHYAECNSLARPCLPADRDGRPRL